ncbi:hypothetical protein Hanom_Chr14g01316721 [Helianthus anomalus]
MPLVLCNQLDMVLDTPKMQLFVHFTRLTNKYLLSLDNVNETIICSSSMHLSLLDSLSVNNIQLVSFHIEIINFPSLVICKSEILIVF